MCAHESKSNTLYTDVAYAYWNDICDMKPLSSEEQNKLIKLIKSGDKAAQDTLIESFLRLVVSRAKIYCYDFDSFMDFVQEGNIGLMVAIKNFDPSKGCQFSTYAQPWIDRYIRRESCRSRHPIHIPERKVQAANQLLVAEKIFIQQNGRNPSVEELVELTGMSSDQIIKLQHILKPVLSFEQKLKYDDSSQSLSNKIGDVETPSPEDILIAKDTKKFLETFMEKNLTSTEFFVLKLRFGLNNKHKSYTLLEVAQKCGLTKEGVRKTEHRALNKLNQAMVKRGLTQVDFI